MDPARAIVVVTTVGTRAEARAMARTLVERQLVACAQITEIESFYRWERETRHDPEFRLWLKTVAERYDEVEAAIRGLHPYELPAIYALAVEHMDAAYAQWVEAASP
jgi:periplasmic divalent cation tolerance protein